MKNLVVIFLSGLHAYKKDNLQCLFLEV